MNAFERKGTRVQLGAEGFLPSRPAFRRLPVPRFRLGDGEEAIVAEGNDDFSWEDFFGRIFVVEISGIEVSETEADVDVDILFVY